MGLCAPAGPLSLAGEEREAPGAFRPGLAWAVFTVKYFESKKKQEIYYKSQNHYADCSRVKTLRSTYSYLATYSLHCYSSVISTQGELSLSLSCSSLSVEVTQFLDILLTVWVPCLRHRDSSVLLRLGARDKLTWVMGSFITRTSVTLPNCPKYSLSLSWLVCQERPPTKSFPGAESEFGVERPLDSPWEPGPPRSPLVERGSPASCSMDNLKHETVKYPPPYNKISSSYKSDIRYL